MNLFVYLFIRSKLHIQRKKSFSFCFGHLDPYYVYLHAKGNPLDFSPAHCEYTESVAHPSFRAALSGVYFIHVNLLCSPGLDTPGSLIWMKLVCTKQNGVPSQIVFSSLSDGLKINVIERRIEKKVTKKTLFEISESMGFGRQFSAF